MGGVDPLWGVWTSDVGAFWQKCENERIWSCMGGMHLAHPPRSANEEISILLFQK